MDYILKKRKTYDEGSTQFLEKKIKYTENEDEILFHRNYRVFSLDHHEIFNFNIYDENIVAIICVPADDRIDVLCTNINDWITRGFKCLLFFSESENNIDFIDEIEYNEKIIGYHHHIKYVSYSCTKLVHIENSAGIARVSAILFLNNFLVNENANIVISDDRRRTKTDRCTITHIFNELNERDLDILFPCSERSYKLTPKRKNLAKEKLKKKLDITKLGQVYIMNYNSIKKICTCVNILKYMSAPIFEDYILLYTQNFIKIGISNNCHRQSIGSQVSIARRKDMTNIDVCNLLYKNGITSYLLRLVVNIIINFGDIKLYTGSGYELHKKILDLYIECMES
jgi:hypothetical protein